MRRISLVSIGLLLLAGCGPSGSETGALKGTIKYKDQPVNGATLQLCPTTGKAETENYITVTQEGTFNTTSVPPGEYRIVVQPSAGNNGMPNTNGMTPEQKAKMQGSLDKMTTKPTIPIPPKYLDVNTTDLKCTIVKGANPELKLELKD